MEVIPLTSIEWSVYAGDHNPPHVHVFYQGYEALISIKTAEKLRGDLPPKQLKLVKAWVLIENEQLLKKWKLRNPNLRD